MSDFAGVGVYQRDLNSCSFRRNTAKDRCGCSCEHATNKALIAETTPTYEPWNDGLAIEVIQETSEKTGNRTLVAVRKSNRRNTVIMSPNDGIHRVLKAATETDGNE